MQVEAEGRFPLALPRIRGVSRCIVLTGPNSNDAIVISFTHEREALIEAVLIRVSFKSFCRD